MIKNSVAKPYAQALFDISREENKYREYYDELNRFSSLLKENPDLKEFFANPIFDRDEKKAVVTEVLKRTDVSATIANFLRLLVDKGRISILDDIEEHYRELIDQVLKKVRIDIKTAFPLTDGLYADLKKTLEEMTGKAVEMSIHEDPLLLGGIVVKIGDTLYDGSIRSQLNHIRELLREGK
ncbi:MAG: ATP synthase F1 subunit delta [Syntrophales bacterium]